MKILSPFSLLALALLYAYPLQSQSAPSQQDLAYRASVAVHAQQLAMPRKAARAFEKGCALMYKYEFPASLAYFRKAIELAPDLFPAYHNLALVQYNLGDFDGAAENFQKAIDLSKGSFAPAFFGLSVVFYNRSQFAEAERVAQQGLTFEPGSGTGKYCVALAQYSLGRTADAHRNVVEALRVDPRLADGYLLLAHIHELLGDPNAVIVDVDTYFKNTLHNDVNVRVDALGLRQRAQQDLARASRQ
jgi:tetratricopeptide (TPR) repeat protein